MAILSSLPSDAETVTLTGDDWWLSDPLVAGEPLAVSVPPGWSPTTKREAAVFDPIDADRSVVVWGETRGIATTLQIRTLDVETYDAVKSLMLAERPFLLRTPWMQRYYLAPAGDVSESALRAAPSLAEAWPLRHAHVLSVPVVEVAEP